MQNSTARTIPFVCKWCTGKTGMMKNVYSVGQVNTYIKNMFAQDFMLQRISVKGEVSNCKYHTSGHIYFTIKDAAGTLNAVMFAGSRKGLKFQMKEGDQVVVTGSVEVYSVMESIRSMQEKSNLTVRETFTRSLKL